MKIKTLKTKLLFGLLFIGWLTPGQAVPVLWSLDEATFNDGGTVSGSFVFDADTGVYSDILLTTTPGTNTAFPGLTYQFDTFAGDPAVFQQFQLWSIVTPTATDGDPQLALGFGDGLAAALGELTNEGGIVTILQGNLVERFCGGETCRQGSSSPSQRVVPMDWFVTGGPVDIDPDPTPVPEPGTLSLLAVGLLGMGLMRRQRRP